MIETAVTLTGGIFPGRLMLAIFDLAKAQLNAPVDLLEHVSETIPRLAARHPLMVITKGDLLDQETKLARSGLGEFFRDIEVVSDKTPQSYATLFRNHALDPAHVLMVGNSLRSDILPVLELGACAVYIPYPGTWLHEAAASPRPRHAPLLPTGACSTSCRPCSTNWKSGGITESAITDKGKADGEHPSARLHYL